MKFFYTLCIAIAMYYTTYSCDVCGCAASGSAMGIQPMFAKHFVGIRYQYLSSTSIAHDGESSSDEVFQTFGIWGRINIAKRLQLFTLFPYKVNFRYTTLLGKTAEHVNGIGDISTTASYMFVNTTHSERKFTHALRGGVGIKLPTGKYDQLHDGLYLHPNIQAGTGSVDLLFNMNYTLRYKKVGVNTEFNYNHNGINKMYFRFGHKYMSTFTFFVWQEKNRFIFLPQIGLQNEYALKDIQSDQIQTHTGGNVLKLNIGIDVYYKKIGCMIQAQYPALQQLGEGFIHSYPQLNTNFIYLF